MRGDGRGGSLTFPRPLPSTVPSNSKSNVAGRLNDRELVTLTRPNNTPAL